MFAFCLTLLNTLKCGYVLQGNEVSDFSVKSLQKLSYLKYKIRNQKMNTVMRRLLIKSQMAE